MAPSPPKRRRGRPSSGLWKVRVILIYVEKLILLILIYMFQCSICPRTLLTRQAMREHEKSHSRQEKLIAMRNSKYKRYSRVCHICQRQVRLTVTIQPDSQLTRQASHTSHCRSKGWNCWIIFRETTPVTGHFSRGLHLIFITLFFSLIHHVTFKNTDMKPGTFWRHKNSHVVGVRNVSRQRRKWTVTCKRHIFLHRGRLFNLPLTEE